MTLSARVVATAGTLELDVDLSVPTGEVVAILGPNGAGKTTLLRALAGLLPLHGGRVALDGEVLEEPAKGIRVPTERRPIGFVFQDYVLFPHLSVLDNVAFPLRCRGQTKKEARAAARQCLAAIGLVHCLESRPRALSGGQAQRVALARAMAAMPRLLLLDEPLAALDAATRVEVRRELRRQLASFEGTRLLVTHDPIEAIILADRLVVVEEGRLVQQGSAAEVTERPRSPYVAELVGLNLFRGKGAGDHVALPSGATLVVPGAGHGDVFAAVHPRAVALHRQRPEGTPRNVWEGRVVSLDLENDRLRVRVDAAIPVVAEITPAAGRELRLAEGRPTWVSVKATEVVVYAA